MLARASASRAGTFVAETARMLLGRRKLPVASCVGPLTLKNSIRIIFIGGFFRRL